MGRWSEVELCGEVEEWLSTKSRSTAEHYRRRMQRFMEWYRSRYGEDRVFGDFLDRLDINAGLPRRERRRLAELEISRFVGHLKDLGYANYTIRNNFVSIQNFLKYKGYPVSMRWVGNMPSATPEKENSKQRWTLEQVEEFVDKAGNYRDKAVILCLFQSGMSISELCRLDYGDVRHELAEERLPVMLEMVRKKTGVPYRTFLGADAVKHLKLYLETRTGLTDDSPLFTKLGTSERITRGAIQKRFREIAEELSYIVVEDGSMNPARPHSMRSAFCSRLKGSMDRDLVEFFMGHTLDGTTQAYLNKPDRELRELYASFEHLLSTETTSKEVKAGLDGRTSKIEQRYQRKIEDLETTLRTQAEQLSQLTQLNQHLSTEIQEMQDRVEPAEKHMQTLRLLMENPETREILTQAAQKIRETAQQQSKQENQPNPANIK